MSASAHRRLHDPKYLVGHWPLNGHAQDVSRHGYDMTLVYDPTFATSHHSGRGCIEFDGDDACVRISDFPPLNNASAFTFCVFLNQDAIDQTGYIMRKYRYASIYTYIKTDLGTGNMYLTIADGSASQGYFDYSTVINARMWHHLAVVFDGSGAANADRLKAYVDGVPVTLAFNLTIPATTGSLTDGYLYLGYTSTSWDGKMRAARIYNTPLTGDEVAALYEYDTR